jgi:hypothetical protein
MGGAQSPRPHHREPGAYHPFTVAFLEYRGHRVNQCATPAGVPEEWAVQCDYVSLNPPNEAALPQQRQRLLEHGCEVTALRDHRLMRAIAFTDLTGCEF